MRQAQTVVDGLVVVVPTAGVRMERAQRAVIYGLVFGQSRHWSGLDFRSPMWRIADSGSIERPCSGK
jgi:hypothetical protein